MLKIVIICVSVFLILNLLAFVFVPPFIIYRVLLVRTKKEKWPRKCTALDNSEQVEMFAKGEQWGDKFDANRTEVKIISQGFNLAGQYFDFGFDKAAVIISGRSESCIYSCYFAEPYRRMGYNVLVIDNRCHGLSDGKYNNTGFTEYVDILEWAKFLHDEKKNMSIVFHGICMGASAALYAMLAENSPDYLSALIADGMFTTFRESFNNHLIDGHHLQFPTTLMVMAMIKKHSKVDAFHYGPVTVIQNLKKPILFLYSLEDKFSLPKNGEELFEKCGGPKKIVWFDKGAHSHIRINNEEKYDKSICDFLESL